VVEEGPFAERLKLLWRALLQPTWITRADIDLIKTFYLGDSIKGKGGLLRRSCGAF